MDYKIAQRLACEHLSGYFTNLGPLAPAKASSEEQACIRAVADYIMERGEALHAAEVARDAAGFVGSVADCIKYLSDEVNGVRW